jgi:MoaA/NifB/PqqE/SkfB family radical SAM enzyme
MNKPIIKQLWVESSGFCNINCVMCGGNPRQKIFTKETGLMSLDFFKSIVDQFIELSGGSLRRIDFRGTGEPLLNLNLPEMVAYSIGKNLLVGVTTKGMLLAEDLSRQLIVNGLTTLTLRAGATQSHGSSCIGFWLSSFKIVLLR